MIKIIVKGRSPTLRHVSRTHRVALDWFSIESIWTPRSKSNILTPKTNEQTCEPREISHVTNVLIFFVCLPLPISVSAECSEVMSKRTQQESGEERVTAKSRPVMSFDRAKQVKGLHQRCHLLHQKARGEADTKVKGF